MSSANIQETQICFSKIAQAAIATPAVAADCMRVNTNNAELADVSLGTESDADEIGKGDEFATQVFTTARSTGRRVEVYCCSEMLAWAIAFGMGNSAATNPATGAYRHTGTFQDPTSLGIELPYLTFVEAIRQGGSAVLDRALVGCVVSGFTLSLGSGPGRASSRLSIALSGTGKTIEPSTITIPAKTNTHLLPAASLGVTINGVNYVSNKNFISAEWSVQSSMRPGYFPGSNFQTPGDSTSGAIEGRKEFASRATSLTFRARFENGSSELTKLAAQTTGTAVLTLQGALITGSTYHDASITFQQVSFQTAQVGSADGLVDVEVSCSVQRHASNGVITAYATNGIPLLGRET